MAAVTPISPSGAVIQTSATRAKLRSCTISTVVTTRKNSGTPARTERWPRPESSTVPPVSSRYPGGSFARTGSSWGSRLAVTCGGCRAP